MLKIRGLSYARRRIVFLGAGLLVAGIALMWSSHDAKAQTGGYSQVSRLELAYIPAGQTLQARVSLASGLALTYQAATDRDIEALLEIAQVFSQDGTRMFVEIKGDAIRSFQISVP